ICGPSAIYRAIIRRCATWWMKRLSKLRWNGNPCRKKKRFGIRHGGSTVPERSGVALSFCRRQASTR
ncbi:hypothetical protein FQF95_23465, partial [Escherichia coli]|nr:hypothetical protein [Escherichia coli]